jgi:protein-disulfide isomerase-like protein with CxxC motif
MDRVKFYFDPRCPWCFQASRWMRRLEELGEVDLSWGLYCLELANLPADGDVMGLGVTARSATALRTAAALDPSDIGRFYAALGRRVWETSEPASDRDLAVRESAAEIGYSSSLLDEAMADPDTWSNVVAQHRALVSSKGGIGVPTLVLDGGDGPAIFGPVISHLPDDEEAVRIWHHVRWFARQDNFFEIKTHRPVQPDVPGWKVPVGKLTFGSRPWMPPVAPDHVPTDGRTLRQAGGAVR